MLHTRTKTYHKMDWGKSQTLPSQGLTVKQLFDRYRKGLPAEGKIRQPVWADEDNDVDLEQINRSSAMDKIDMAYELMEANAQKEADIIADNEARKAEAQRKADEKAASQARKAADQAAKA